MPQICAKLSQCPLWRKSRRHIIATFTNVYVLQVCLMRKSVSTYATTLGPIFGRDIFCLRKIPHYGLLGHRKNLKETDFKISKKIILVVVRIIDNALYFFKMIPLRYLNWLYSWTILCKNNYHYPFILHYFHYLFSIFQLFYFSDIKSYLEIHFECK